MATRGTEVHALQEKLRIFSEIAHQAGIIQRPSIKDLAGRLGSNYETLKSSWRDGRLSADIIEACARVGCFEQEQHLFIDPLVSPRERSNAAAVYPGRDTVAAFRALLLRTLKVSRTTTRVSGTPRIRNRNIAWFQIDDAGQARSQETPSELFLVIGFDTAEFEELTVGITEVRLQISFHSSTTGRATHILGLHGRQEFRGAYLTARKADMLPEWILTSSQGVLQNEFVTTEQPLLEIAGLTIGEEFTAILSFKPNRALDVCVSYDEPLNIVKRRIIGALFVESLEECPDRDGWITLGVQKMMLVRGDQVVA